MNFKIKEILIKIAKENDLSLEQVKQIYESEFESVREMMKEGVQDQPDTFKNINIIKLGKIHARESVIKKLATLKKKRNNVEDICKKGQGEGIETKDDRHID